MNTTATILNLGVQQTQTVNKGSQTATKGRAAEEMTSDQAVSYTHLDVYKRQA